MLRAEVCATFKVVYRGYDIEVSRAPAGWQAGVYPRSADLPILLAVRFVRATRMRRLSRPWIVWTGYSGPANPYS
jgi:hypothetical protein